MIPTRKRVRRRRLLWACLLCVLLPVAYFLIPRDGILPFCHRLYINGRIHTLNPQSDITAAMLVSCGRIEWTGSQHDALKKRRWYTRLIDLKGRNVVPGFIDAHSHFPLPGLSQVAANLNPPPVGSTGSLSRLYQTMREHAASIDEGEWVFGFNYDNTVFAGGRHPDRRFLDAVSSVHPIYVRHNSGHMGVANSLGLERLGIKEELSSPENRYIGKYPGSTRLNGLLQESAAPSLSTFINALDFRQQWRFYRAAIKLYSASGYTTVQAGGVTSSNARLLGWLSRLLRQPLRLAYWINHDSEGFTLSDDSVLQHDELLLSPGYFHLAAVKVYADGSPQGFTAYLSRPYYSSAPGIETEEGARPYRGYPQYQPEQWGQIIAHYWLRQMPLAIHTNGDAAIDDVLDGVMQVMRERPTLNAYPVTLVHAQTLRQDQAERAAALGVEASFFIGHTYYWGEWHWQKSLGRERAENVSPLAWAESAGLRYSLHSDAPVTPPSAIDMLWSATTRETSGGRILGAHQRISRMSALKALTTEAARQAGVEQHRGTLEIGKDADFVVLSDDPLQIDNLRDLHVLETIVGGRRIYVLPDSQ